MKMRTYLWEFYQSLYKAFRNYSRLQGTQTNPLDTVNSMQCPDQFRVIDIDGGMSKPYQKTTGIAGFTLVSSERGLALYAHRPFAGRAAALMTDVDLTSDVRVLE